MQWGLNGNWLGTEGTNMGIDIMRGDKVSALQRTGGIVLAYVGGKVVVKAAGWLAKDLEKVADPAIGKNIIRDAGSNAIDGELKTSLKNIDDFIAGNKNFDDVLDDYAKIYSEKINSNQRWQWDEDILGGDNLTRAQKAKIKEIAVAKGNLPNIKINKIDGKSFADFKSAGIVKEIIPLPEDKWLLSDKKQFEWLDEQIGGHVDGYTWHHSEIPGEMELVPFGIHNITNHNGGRTTGMWAYAPR